MYNNSGEKIENMFLVKIANKGTYLSISEHKMLRFLIKKNIIENDNSLVVISLFKVSKNEFFQIF